MSEPVISPSHWVWGEVDYLRTENARLGVVIAELMEALQECADDLEAEAEHQFKDTKDYPSELRRYQRDMAPVRKARAAIAKAKGEA